MAIVGHRDSLEELLNWAEELGLHDALETDALEALGGDSPRWDQQLAQLQELSGPTVMHLLLYGEDLLAGTKTRALRAKLLREAVRFLEEALEAQLVGQRGSSGIPTTYPHIVLWAREHQLEWSLERTVNLPGQPPVPGAGHQSWKVFLSRLAWERDPEPIAQAAHAYLKRQEQLQAQALEEEAKQPPGKVPLPKERVLHPLVKALREAYASLRQRTPPVTADLLQSVRWVVEKPHPLVVRFDFEPASGLGAIQDGYIMFRRNPPQVEWDLMGSRSVRDVAALAAIRRLHHELCEGDGEPRRDITEALAQPLWHLALRALDNVSEMHQPAKAPTPGRLGWLLSTEDWGLPKLTPRVERLGKRGDYLKARNTSWKVALDNPQWQQEPGDGRVMEVAALLREVGGGRWSPGLLRFRQLQGLVGHPRVSLADDPGEPVRVYNSPLAFTPQEEGQQVWLRASLSGQVYTPAELEAVDWVDEHPCGVLVDAPRRLVHLVTATAAQLHALEILRVYDDPIPQSEAPELVERLPAYSQTLGFALSGDGLGTEVPANQEIMLQLEVTGQQLDARLCVRAVPRSPIYEPGEGPERVISLTEGEDLRWAHRNLAQEVRQGEAIRDALAWEGSGWKWGAIEPQAALRMLQRARNIPNLTVVWSGPRRWKVQGRAKASDLQLELNDVRDWFGLSGAAKIDGNELSLAALIQAIRQGESFVPVGEDAWVEITTSLQQQLSQLAAAARVSTSSKGKQRVEVPLSALPTMDELLSRAELTRASERFTQLRRRMNTSADLQPPEPAVEAQLRPYQQEGYRWLYRMSHWGLGCILADDMGLGKTLQALAVLTERGRDPEATGPALVVAPTSLGFNWVQETERFAPGLRPLLYRGAQRQQLLAQAGPQDVLITSYGLMLRDAEVLGAHPFHTVVFDEAQNLKNARTRRSRAARGLQASWRLGLTGTPLENHAGELWSLFHVIEPGLLGSWEHFRSSFTGPWHERAPQLAELIRPFVLRRTKRQVAPELPPRTVVNVQVPLGKTESKLYREARLATLAHLSELVDELPAEKRHFQVLAALTRLRQLACDPRLLKDHAAALGPSAKLEHAVSLLETVAREGRQALVFSQFTGLLDLAERELKARNVSYLRLDGSTPAATRAKHVAAFQSGGATAFLISLKAGGAGLNLTAADTVIHLDPWWNPAVEDQATDRTHRIGQTHPVTVYRLVSRHTVEEEILRLHETKRELVDQLLSGADQAGALSTEDLAALIRGGGG